MPRFPRWARGIIAATFLFSTPSLAKDFIPQDATAKSRAGGFAKNLAQGAAGMLKLDVDARCAGGDVSFRVRNAGEAWPKSATFVIYRLGVNAPQAVVKRRMRLKDGQRASFRIAKQRNPTGRLGIFVEPGWYDRSFVLDAKVDCLG